MTKPLLIGCAFAGFILLAAPLASPQAAPPAVVRTLHGTVIDSIHGRPIPRALVRINLRAVLTDALGHFEFAGYTDTQAYVSANKPGFSAPGGNTDGPSFAKVDDLDGPILVRLVPDAVITGLITDRSGQPLPRIQVTVLRARYDQPGITSVQTGSATTDSRGIYRLSVPPGQVRLQTRYLPAVEATGEALLPVSYPEQTAGRPAVYERLQPGQEQRVDLHPAGGIPYPLEIRAAGADPQRPLRGIATPRSGISFQVPSRLVAAEPNVFRVDLPAGTYGLTLTADDRNNPSTASLRVTVPAGGMHNAAPIDVTLSPETRIPVQMSLDSAVPVINGVVSSVSVAQLNLTLHSDGSNGSEVIRLRSSAERPDEFQVPPGRYRLRTETAGYWTIVSASYGLSNAISDEIVVGEGSGASPLRLVVSNATGHLDGSVNLPAGVASARVYLLPREPSLVPFYLLLAGSSGSFSRNLPPGHYVAVAVGGMVEADLRDPAVATKLAGQGKLVEITNGGKASVALDLAPGLEGTP